MSKGRPVTVKKGTGSQLRKLAVAVAMALAAGKASALGLGEIKLHSALNEPLNAEIQLFTDRPAELDGAVVRLAPQDAFRQAGIDWPAVLGDLTFTVTPSGNGTAVVRVTSTQPVREPFLDFIVQLQWPAGRLLREYTVLLDPPVFGANNKPVPVAAPAISAPPSPAPAAAAPAVPPTDKAKVPAPSPGSAPSAAPRPTAPAVKTATNGYGPTQRTDTAWAVAAQVRPDNSVTVQQAMLALLQSNPDAFYGRNVNNLLAGHILRVPAREQMVAVPAPEAAREVARQYEQWTQAKRGGVPAAGPANPPAAAKPGTAAPESAAALSRKADDAARLRLASPSETTAAAPGAGGQSIDKLHNDLAIALESADAARHENEELRSRLSALEAQINSMQRLMTLKDGSLAEMQKQPGSAPAPAAPPVRGETLPAPAQQPPVKAKPVEPVKPAPSTSLFDNPMLIAALGGAALLLLIVAWLVARRRREGDDGEEARFEPIVAQAAAEAAALKQSRHAAASPIADDMAPTAQMNTVAEEVAREADGAAAETASDLDMMRTAEGDIDPIVEADVYLAYRRYQQAEALIQNALAKEPDRLELKLKLLEIYYAARNAESFQATAEALHNELWQHPDDALWQRVVAMGAELLPGHVLFTNAAPVEAPPVGGVGAALFAAGDHPIDVPQAEMAPAADDDFLGFDSKAAAPAGGEQSLELDLNVAADAHGLEEMAGGAKDELASALDLPGTQPGSAASRAPIADNSRWNTEPALSDFGNMDFNLDDADFLAGTDVVGTKLDLARAYIDMGDHDSAREILHEVLKEGNEQQKQEAHALGQQIA